VDLECRFFVVVFFSVSFVSFANRFLLPFLLRAISPPFIIFVAFVIISPSVITMHFVRISIIGKSY